jgi:signal transduction histidine kinase
LQLQRNPRLIFTSAIFLLTVCGLALGWTLYRIYSGEKWVRHSYDAQLLIGEIQSGLASTGRARQVYLQTGDAQYLEDIETGHQSVLSQVTRLKEMLEDNSDQVKKSAKLEEAAKGRFATLEASVQLAKAGKSTHDAQDGFTRDLVKWSQQTAEIAGEMQDAESRLLDRRLLLTNSLFISIVTIFATMYLLSLYMLFEYHRDLNWELAERKLAEQNALNLSMQLLKIQDQERRKVARDVHDGLGQYLVAAKMIADSFVNRTPDKEKTQELSTILGEALTSSRSITYLLHPPLVDELGFCSAARAYLEGFSSRTGVEIRIDLPDIENRLPQDLELVLFRVLQEALSNIQRHSKAAKAEVQFNADSRSATLNVRDNGVGLPEGMIDDLNEHGTRAGVGLAGMKERVRERNGKFEIRSDSGGTVISATFPLTPKAIGSE